MKQPIQKPDLSLGGQTIGLFERSASRREQVLTGLFALLLLLAWLFVERVDPDPVFRLIAIGALVGIACGSGMYLLRRYFARQLGSMPTASTLVILVVVYVAAVATPITTIATVGARAFFPSWDLAARHPLVVPAVLFGASLLWVLDLLLRWWHLRSLAAAREASRADSELRRLAYEDPLTGLANRRLFDEAINDLLSVPHQPYAVMYMDFDKFKLVNDVHGHSMGDAFLQTVAARLKTVIRSGDLVARLGGDEYAVLIRGHEALLGVERLAQRIVRSLDEPMEFSGVQLRTSVSLGLALSTEIAGPASAVMEAADKAMYLAKRRGGGGYERANL